MFYLLIIVLLVAFVLSFYENLIMREKVYVYYAICAFLVCLAAFRPIGFDRDSTNYEYYFFHFDSPEIIFTVDYSFRLLSSIFLTFTNDVHSIFFVYAFLAIIVKFYSIKKLSSIIFLPLVIYIGNYYLLQDMTQIRAGVSSALLLLSIIPLSEGNRMKCMLIYLLATFFHMSSVIFFFLLFLNNKPLSGKYRVILASLVPLGYILYFIGFDPISILPFSNDKIASYQLLKDKGVAGEDINVFGFVFLFKVVAYLYMLYMYDTVYEYNKYIPILLKIMGLSIFLFLLLAFLPVLSFRLSQLYGIVDILVMSSIYYTIKPRSLSAIIVSIIGIVLFSINIFYTKIFYL
jgi:hypothetical protein